jgi:hypothetical protein
MSAKEMFEVPNDLDLIEWFGSEPLKEGNGRYRYVASDSRSSANEFQTPGLLFACER